MSLTYKTNEQQSSNLVLTTSYLSKCNFILINPCTPVSSVNLDPANLRVISRLSLKEKSISIEMSYEAKAVYNNQDFFSLDLVYFGQFSFNDHEDTATLNNFAKANAPAIIFPLLRSAVAMITIGAGVPPLTLGTINFYKFPVQLEEVD